MSSANIDSVLIVTSGVITALEPSSTMHTENPFAKSSCPTPAFKIHPPHSLQTFANLPQYLTSTISKRLSANMMAARLLYGAGVRQALYRTQMSRVTLRKMPSAFHYFY
jgi:hypothetical protein